MEYRNPENRTAFRVSVALVALLAVMGVAVAAEYSPVFVPIVLAVAFGAIVLFHRIFRRPSLIASDDGLLIQNPLGSDFVPWEAFHGAEGGRLLIVRTEDGRQLRVWAVQNSNWVHLTSGQGYADVVAQELERLRHPPTDQ